MLRWRSVWSLAFGPDGLICPAPPPLPAVRWAGYDAGREDRSPVAFEQCVTPVSLCDVVIMRNRFVQGTDPEAILLLDAVRRDGSPHWQYAFARATSAGLEARLDKSVVWTVDVLAGTTPRDPQLWLGRPRERTASGR
jgi:hypothetical protein